MSLSTLTFLRRNEQLVARIYGPVWRVGGKLGPHSCILLPKEDLASNNVGAWSRPPAALAENEPHLWFME